MFKVELSEQELTDIRLALIHRSADCPDEELQRLNDLMNKLARISVYGHA